MSDLMDPGAQRMYPGKSLYSMQPVEECVGQVLRHVRGPLGVVQLPLGESWGRVIASDVAAASPIPPFPAAIMDGFAVRSDDGPGRFPVDALTGATAGGAVQGVLAQGHVRYVTVGAPIPDGADAVVKVEDTKETWDEGRLLVDILVSSRPGVNIRKVGSDTAKGDVVVRKGSRIGAGEIGVLAAVGLADVTVCRRPRVAFFFHRR